MIVTRAGLEGVLNILRSSYNGDTTAEDIWHSVPCEELNGSAITLLAHLIDQQAIGPEWLNGLSWCDRTELYLEEVSPPETWAERCD